MKKTLSLVLTIIGMAGLVFGVIMLFKGNIMESNAWIGAILGVIFFTSGIGLMKSTGNADGQVSQ